MINDTRFSQKVNIHHTNTNLVQTFIASELSHEIELVPLDITILFVIARYLDMPKKECFAKQTVLAHECRTDRTHFGRRSSYLVSQHLLFRFLRGKLYRYELGEIITGVKSC